MHGAFAFNYLNLQNGDLACRRAGQRCDKRNRQQGINRITRLAARVMGLS